MKTQKKQKIVKPARCACCGSENVDICLVGDEYGYTRKELLCRTCDAITVLDKSNNVVGAKDNVAVVTREQHKDIHCHGYRRYEQTPEELYKKLNEAINKATIALQEVTKLMSEFGNEFKKFNNLAEQTQEKQDL